MVEPMLHSHLPLRAGFPNLRLSLAIISHSNTLAQLVPAAFPGSSPTKASQVWLLICADLDRDHEKAAAGRDTRGRVTQLAGRAVVAQWQDNRPRGLTGNG